MYTATVEVDLDVAACTASCKLQLTLNVYDIYGPCVCLTLAGRNFTEQYQSLDPDVYYIKLDDDTMYVGEQAIDMMLHEKLRDRFFIVSANVINHSGIHWLVQYLCLAMHHLSCKSTSLLINSLHCKFVQYESTLYEGFLGLDSASQTTCCLH